MYPNSQDCYNIGVKMARHHICRGKVFTEFNPTTTEGLVQLADLHVGTKMDPSVYMDQPFNFLYQDIYPTRLTLLQLFSFANGYIHAYNKCLLNREQRKRNSIRANEPRRNGLYDHEWEFEGATEPVEVFDSVMDNIHISG